MYSASSSESLQSCRYKRGQSLITISITARVSKKPGAKIQGLSIVAEPLNSILPDSPPIRAARPESLVC